MMGDYYLEIFLGVSIGAFLVSLLLLISLYKENLKSRTHYESIITDSKA